MLTEREFTAAAEQYLDMAYRLAPIIDRKSVV